MLAVDRYRPAVVRAAAYMATFHEGVLLPVQCFCPKPFRRARRFFRGCGMRPRLESSTTLPRVRNSSSVSNSKSRRASFSICRRSACKSPTSRCRTGHSVPLKGIPASLPPVSIAAEHEVKAPVKATRHCSALRRLTRGSSSIFDPSDRLAHTAKAWIRPMTCLEVSARHRLSPVAGHRRDRRRVAGEPSRIPGRVKMGVSKAHRPERQKVRGTFPRRSGCRNTSPGATP